jgi:hypothetical protein
MTDRRIFLCHSSADKPTVRQLYGRLLTDGFRPWLDEEDLLPGQDWELEIGRAIAGSAVIVVCLSVDSTTKTGYVQREIRLVLDAADLRPPGSIFVIPARLEDCPVPDRLARWQWVDLYEEDGYRKLRRSLDAALPAGDPAPTAVRFDGLYATAPDGDGRAYLRFTEDGLAYAVGTVADATPADVARWLGPDHSMVSRGPFSVRGETVEIDTASPSGRVEYRGSVAAAGTELRLHTRSYINGHESFGVWRFTPVAFPDRPEGLSGGGRG